LLKQASNQFGGGLSADASPQQSKIQHRDSPTTAIFVLYPDSENGPLRSLSAVPSSD
jgi:hypothetical protein